jgi:hypothetical protein
MQRRQHQDQVEGSILHLEKIAVDEFDLGIGLGCTLARQLNPLLIGVNADDVGRAALLRLDAEEALVASEVENALAGQVGGHIDPRELLGGI